MATARMQTQQHDGRSPLFIPYWIKVVFRGLFSRQVSVRHGFRRQYLQEFHVLALGCRRIHVVAGFREMLAADSQLLFQPFVFTDHPGDSQHLQPFAGNATPPPRETVIWKSRIRRRRHPLRVPDARRIRTRPHCTHARHRRYSADLHHDSPTTDPSRTQDDEWWLTAFTVPLLHQQDRNIGGFSAGGRDHCTGQKGKSYTASLGPGVPSFESSGKVLLQAPNNRGNVRIK